MQMFVQTEKTIVEVSKIAHIDASSEARVVVHFEGGTMLELPAHEAAQLLDGIGELARRNLLVAHRCRDPEKPSAPPAPPAPAVETIGARTRRKRGALTS